jgi:hypothetical protein
MIFPSQKSAYSVDRRRRTGMEAVLVTIPRLAHRARCLCRRASSRSRRRNSSASSRGEREASPVSSACGEAPTGRILAPGASPSKARRRWTRGSLSGTMLLHRLDSRLCDGGELRRCGAVCPGRREQPLPAAHRASVNRATGGTRQEVSVASGRRIETARWRSGRGRLAMRPAVRRNGSSSSAVTWPVFRWMVSDVVG